MLKGNDIERFKKTYTGHFSNKEQVYQRPKDFAHINIYIRELPYNFFMSNSFYSEQSFNYDPWKPYRQSVQRLYIKENRYIIENYLIQNAQRIAGAGFNKELLKNISLDQLLERKGCNMIFQEDRRGHFIGKIEDGQKCIVKRDNKVTYLVSNVELFDNTWISIDEGYDINSSKKIWGSSNGKLYFKKVN